MFDLFSLKSTIIRQNTKNGKRTGKILVDQTIIPFKQDFAYVWGLNAIIKHKNNVKSIANLFDFIILIIYNNICNEG